MTGTRTGSAFQVHCQAWTWVCGRRMSMSGFSPLGCLIFLIPDPLRAKTLVQATQTGAELVTWRAGIFSAETIIETKIGKATEWSYDLWVVEVVSSPGLLRFRSLFIPTEWDEESGDINGTGHAGWLIAMYWGVTRPDNILQLCLMPQCINTQLFVSKQESWWESLHNWCLQFPS